MASVSAIRDGLKTRLATISGLNAYDTVPGDIITPAAIVQPGNPLLLYDTTMGRGGDELRFTVTLLVSTVVDDVAQDSLDAYLAGSGSSSVKTAIEADGTLAGAAHYTVVTQVTSYGLLEWAEVTYLGAELLVEVVASGS